MSTLGKFDYQKFYISDKIDELAEVCTSRFWVVVIQKLLERLFSFYLGIYCNFLSFVNARKGATFFFHIWIEFKEFDI